MKILVTGGAGFIGSHVCESFLEMGHIVYNVDNFDPFYDRKIKENNIRYAQENENYYLIEEDIRDKVKLLKELEKIGEVDVIIHLAAKAGVRPSIEDPEAYVQTNVLGTNNLLEFACNQKKLPKFIFASSSSIYGNNKKIPFSENDSVDQPISPYASTKKAAEMLCYTFHHLYDLPVMCLRFFTVYGPRQRPDLAIHKFANLIYHNKAIDIYGDGSSSRDYTFIKDIVDAIVKISDLDYKFDILNLGNNSPVKLNDLIEQIEVTMDKKAIKEYKDLPPGDVNRTWADISKAAELISFSAQTPMKKGLSEFYDWYVNNLKGI